MNEILFDDITMLYVSINNVARIEYYRIFGFLFIWNMAVYLYIFQINRRESYKNACSLNNSITTIDIVCPGIGNLR
ncbi:hypothetical protein V1478_003274 [Vespula squamosa]|uniref:Uncharacterized protein n=1 Tax=Vespula squamosa TaxID=30214 RepID=A0ABD2BS79_VESSQ